MKYIVTLSEQGKDIFLFPRSINHDCMAEVLGQIKNQSYGDWELVDRTPVSAGFVDPEGNCYGGSVTLNLKSKPEEDTLLLKTKMAELS